MGDPTGPIDRDEEDGDAINVPTTCTACGQPAAAISAIGEQVWSQKTG